MRPFAAMGWFECAQLSTSRLSDSPPLPDLANPLLPLGPIVREARTSLPLPHRFRRSPMPAGPLSANLLATLAGLCLHPVLSPLAHSATTLVNDTSPPRDRDDDDRDRDRDRDDDDDDDDDRHRERGHRDRDREDDDDDDDAAPATIDISATIRDFLPRSAAGGHTDFGISAGSGRDVVAGLVSSALGAQRVPAYDGSGQRIQRPWTDSRGRSINPALYSSSSGDSAGRFRSGAVTGDILSTASFAQWFTDVPALNLSTDYTLTFTRSGDAGSPTYSFTTSDFTPIDGLLFDESGSDSDDCDDDDCDHHHGHGRGHDEHGRGRGRGHDDDDDDDDDDDHNRFFTLTFTTSFEYDASASQYLTVTSANDLWVFVDGQLAIDLGSSHSQASQTISPVRLGLTDGQSYDVDFFFAQRTDAEAPLSILTNITLSDGSADSNGADSTPVIVFWEEVEN